VTGGKTAGWCRLSRHCWHRLPCGGRFHHEPVHWRAGVFGRGVDQPGEARRALRGLAKLLLMAFNGNRASAARSQRHRLVWASRATCPSGPRASCKESLPSPRQSTGKSPAIMPRPMRRARPDNCACGQPRTQRMALTAAERRHRPRVGRPPHAGTRMRRAVTLMRQQAGRTPYIRWRRAASPPDRRNGSP